MKKNRNEFVVIKNYSLRLLLLIFLLFPLAAWSQQQILRVGVAPGEPFVTVSGGQYGGIAVNIWKMLAQNLNLQYVFVPMSEHIDDDVKLLANGNVDVLIGPIIPTKERLELVDFTRPFYLNQIGIVVPKKQIYFFSTLLKVLLSSTFIWAATVLLAIFVLYIHIFWFFERRKNYMGVQQTYWKGIKTAFWINTLGISFGQIPTYPHTRIFRFIWFLALILLLSTITATITSSLTVVLSNNYIEYNSLSDFSDKVIVAVIDTAPYDIAKETGLNVIPAQNRDEAINMLLNKKAAGFADYYPIADYYLHTHQLSTQLTLANAIIAQNTFAFALPYNSPLRHQLDFQLETIQMNGQIKFLCQNILGEKAAKNCEI